MNPPQNLLVYTAILALSIVGSFLAAQQILWGTVYIMERFAPILYLAVGAAATAFILGNRYTNRERAYMNLLNDFARSNPHMTNFMAQRLQGVGVKIPPAPPTAIPFTGETGTAFDQEAVVSLPNPEKGRGQPAANGKESSSPVPLAVTEDPVAKMLTERGIKDQPPAVTNKKKRGLLAAVVNKQQ